MQRLRILYVAFAAVLVTAGVIPRSNPLHDRVITLSFTGVLLVGVAVAGRAATHPLLDTFERRPWRFVVVWFVLQAIYGTISGKAVDEGHFANRFSLSLVIALTCHLLEAPAMLMGLTAFLSEPLTRGQRRKLAMDATTVIGAAFMVIWYFMIGPSLSMGGSSFRLATVVIPLSDLVLLVGVTTVLMRGALTHARRPLLLLLVATAAGLGRDVWVIIVAVYQPGQQMSVWQVPLGIFPVMLTAAAALERCLLAGSEQSRQIDRQRLRPYNWLPYLALAAGYSLLIVVAARAGVFPWVGLVVGAMIMTFGVAVRQVIALRENHELVVTDALTGLANRLLFDDRLVQAAANSVASSQPMAVLLIDLDDFKSVNDNHGHDTGDRVLVTFADVLRGSVRHTDTTARLGGDEFAVILDGVTNQQDAIDVALRLIADIDAHPMQIGGEARRIGCSIGIALRDPRDLDLIDLADLINQADQAMYRAKRSRTTGWALYNGRMAAAHAEVPVQRRVTDAVEQKTL